MPFFGTLATPVGTLGVTSTGDAITAVTWRSTPPVGVDAGSDPLLSAAIDQLAAYFAGRLRGFDLPFDLGEHTDGTRVVLTTLYDSVRYGESITYGGLAARSGSGIPARRIGAIMGANPIPIIVPCHRVLAGDGLGGYSGGRAGEGLATKRWLLEHEGVLPTSLF